MYSIFLYGIIGILSLAMFLYISGFLSFKLGLGLITTALYTWADTFMLWAFAMLAIMAVLAAIAQIFKGMRTYFCREAVALRRVWFFQAQKLNELQRSNPELRQLQYRNLVKRQRILAADNRKHSGILYDAIKQELHFMKLKMSEDHYQFINDSLRKYYKNGDVEAMLVLRKKILCR